MHRLALVFCLFSSAVCTVAQNSPSSDPLAISLAQQSVAALSGGAAIGDVTMNANVISIIGSDKETGTGIFAAKGMNESRVDLQLSRGTRSDVRNMTNTVPGGAWKKDGGTITTYVQQNCWVDAAWFFPALSSLAQASNQNFVFKYVGQEQHGGVNVQHIRVFQNLSRDFPRLSTMEFYLDSVSSVPVAIAFYVHADDDMNTNIPSEIRFANYQPVSGIQVPFHFQRILIGGVVLDATVTSAAFNTGLQDAVFTLQ